MKARIILASLVSAGVLGFSLTTYAAPLGQAWKIVHWKGFSEEIPTYWVFHHTQKYSAFWGPSNPNQVKGFEVEFDPGVPAFRFARWIALPGTVLRENLNRTEFEIINNTDVLDIRTFVITIPQLKGAVILSWSVAPSLLNIAQQEMHNWSFQGINNPFDSGLGLFPRVQHFVAPNNIKLMQVPWTTAHHGSLSVKIPANWLRITASQNAFVQWQPNGNLTLGDGYFWATKATEKSALTTLVAWADFANGTSKLFAWENPRGYVSVVPQAGSSSSVVTEVVPASPNQNYVVQAIVPTFELSLATTMLQSWHLGNLNLYHQNGHLVLPTLVSPSVAQQFAKQYGP